MKPRLITINIKFNSNLANLLEKYDATARLLSCKLVKNDRALLMIEIISNNNLNNKTLYSSLRHELGRKNVIIINANQNKSLIVTTLKHPAIHNAVSKSKTFCMTCPFLTLPRNGYTPWTILIPSSKSLKHFINELEKKGINTQIISSRKISLEPLTPREIEILKTAYNLGYYNYPRSISFNELAKKLGIVPSTLSEALRKAEKKLILSYMRNLSNLEYALTISNLTSKTS
jgi:predicted DNA binding protein